MIHRVCIQAKDDDHDLLARVDTMTAVMYRVLTHAQLIEVEQSDFRGGYLQMLVETHEKVPAIRNGSVNITIQTLTEEAR